jgi:DNA helicase-2/ATP-dependent DNA helicase PcrA
VSHVADDDDEGLAEERRLLYVGITRARRYLALSWARHRPSATGKPQVRTMSRFLRPLGGIATGERGGLADPVRVRTTASAGRRALAVTPLDADATLLDSLRAWRRERAVADAVPAYVVATDATLRAIAERLPRDERDLLAVPGIGPARAARYGDQILAIVGGQTARGRDGS